MRGAKNIAMVLVAILISDIVLARSQRVQSNKLRLHDFDEFFNHQISLEIGLTRSLIDEATHLRAQYGFKTPDALHLAAAIEADCDVFLTNDHHLDHCRAITVEVLE